MNAGDPPGTGNPQPGPPPGPFPLRTAADVVAMLEAVANDVSAGGNPLRAKTLAYVGSVSLHAINLATIEARLEAVERELRRQAEEKRQADQRSQR